MKLQIGKPVMGFGVIVLSNLLFSTKSIFIKQAYAYGLEVVPVMTLRMLLSLPVLMIGVIYLWSQAKPVKQNQVRPKDWVVMVVVALTGYYFASLLDLKGLQTLSVSIERIILYIYPTFVVVLSVFLLKQKVDKSLFAPLLLSYFGLLIIFYGPGQTSYIDMYGALYVLSSAFCYAVFMIGAKHLVEKFGPARLATYGMMVASLAILIHFCLSYSMTALTIPPDSFGLFIGMALFSTVIPVYLMIYGLKLVSAGYAAVLGCTGPVFTIFMGWILLNETLAPNQTVGVVVTLGGGLLLSFKKSRTRAVS